MKNQLRILFVLLVGVYTTSCTPEEPAVVVVENQYLKSDELVNTLDIDTFKSQITSFFGENGSQVLLFVQSGIEQHRITYETKDVNGNTILASGAVIIPTDFPDIEFAFGSLHHGTITDEANIPSKFKIESESSLGSFMASTGIVIGMPDYVGYGESNNLPHPYEHYRGLAEPNTDFILAATELLKDLDVPWNGTLMLGGYSEGGYAAMATQKWIQENKSDQLAVKVSVLGAGAYNKTATIKKLVTENSPGVAANNRSYIWVLDTYKSIYGLDRPYSYYFQEPYASQIDSNGIFTEITASFNSILTQEFKTDFEANNYPELSAAVADNDIYDWKPNAITKLYHGNADDFVPFINSQSAFDAMQNNGATDVELITVEDGNHGTTLSTYVFGLLQQFTTYKGGEPGS